MNYRKLRIALSVACGLVGVLLVALWVRSYWRSDSVSVPILWPDGFSITSFNGRLMICEGESNDPVTDWDYEVVTFDNSRGPAADFTFLGPVFAFHLLEEDGGYIHVPHWFPALVAGLIAFAFAKRRAYSLRTLLVIISVVAIGLGLIAFYATHASQGGRGGGGGGDVIEGEGGLAYMSWL